MQYQDEVRSVLPATLSLCCCKKKSFFFLFRSAESCRLAEAEQKLSVEQCQCMHAISFLVVGCDARRNATIAGAGDAFAIVPLPNTMYM